MDQLELGGKETGAYDIAVDTVQAGPGDTVLVMGEGRRARQILGLDPGAIRAVVVGVVDEVSVGGYRPSPRSPRGLHCRSVGALQAGPGSSRRSTTWIDSSLARCGKRMSVLAFVTDQLSAWLLNGLGLLGCRRVC